MKEVINKKVIIICLIVLIVLAIVVVAIYGIISEKSINEQVINEKVIGKTRNSEVVVLPIEEVNGEIIIGDLETTEGLNEDVEQQQEDISQNTTEITSNTTYYIKINNLANVVTIYTKDENGEYTKPVKAMICSTGTATPKSGKYKITTYRRLWNGLQGNVYGQYAVQIIGNILFHSVPYTQMNDYSSLEWWEYDKLGTAASLRMC